MKHLIGAAVVTADRVEAHLPRRFVEFFPASDFSPNSIRLGAWPEKVYAGRLHKELGELELFFLDPVRL